MMRNLIPMLVLYLPILAVADSVVPIDTVENNVNIRLAPDSSSDVIGKLDQGSSIELVGSVDGWYEVQLEDDATGYISADWTRVIATETPVEEVQPSEAVAEVVTETVVEGTVEVEVIAAEPDEVISEPVVEETAAEVVVDTTTEEAVVEDAVEVVVEVEEAIEEEDIVEERVEEGPAVQVRESQPEELVVADISLKGTKNYLVKFRDETNGSNSQIFDDGNRIGIGTSDPQQRLEVNGSIQIKAQNSSVAGLMITQSSGDTGYIMHNRASTLTIGAGSQDRITIDRNGNVGIAVSRPNHPLEMASGAHVTAGGAWTNSSSRDRKENIAVLPAEAATSALMALQPVVFNYSNEADEDYIGFIAEDVPELVATRQRDALSTMDIVAVLTRVVQQQQQQIKALEARIDAHVN